MVVYETISEGKGEKPKQIVVTYDLDVPYFSEESGWIFKQYVWAYILPEDDDTFIRGEYFPGDTDRVKEFAKEISQEYPECDVYILWHE